MADVLDQNEVDALLNAVAGGEFASDSDAETTREVSASYRARFVPTISNGPNASVRIRSWPLKDSTSGSPAIWGRP